MKKLDPGISTHSLSDIHFTDANVGYVSLGNRIFKTTDAGNTWNMIVALAKSEIIEIHFSDPSHGWACCFDGTILKFN